MFSPDRTHITLIYGKLLKIWKTNPGYNHYEASSHVYNNVYISPDEQLVALRSTKEINILDATTGVNHCLWSQSSTSYQLGCHGDKHAPTLRVYFRNFFEFSSIFNRLFWLNLCYFCRNTALLIKLGCTAFIMSLPWGRLMSAMSSKHVMASTIINAISGRHALLRLRLNSKMHWTNRHVTCYPPAVPNQAKCITFTTMDHFIILPTPLVKNITIYGSTRSLLVRSSF